MLCVRYSTQDSTNELLWRQTALIKQNYCSTFVYHVHQELRVLDYDSRQEWASEPRPKQSKETQQQCVIADQKHHDPGPNTHQPDRPSGCADQWHLARPGLLRIWTLICQRARHPPCAFTRLKGTVHPHFKWKLSSETHRRTSKLFTITCQKKSLV